MLAVIQQFGIDWKLVVFETINFLVVLSILYFFVFKKISVFLDDRQSTIKQGVENATEAEKMLATAEDSKEQIIKDAKQEASDTIAASVARSKERESEIIDLANTDAEALLQKAKLKGEQEKEGIIASSKEDIAKMITLGAEKILAQK